MNKKLLNWLLANILIQLCGPFLYYSYLSWRLDYEYATGLRNSTDGDIILIPAYRLVRLLVPFTYWPSTSEPQVVSGYFVGKGQSNN